MTVDSPSSTGPCPAPGGHSDAAKPSSSRSEDAKGSVQAGREAVLKSLETQASRLFIRADKPIASPSFKMLRVVDFEVARGLGTKCGMWSKFGSKLQGGKVVIDIAKPEVAKALRNASYETSKKVAEAPLPKTIFGKEKQDKLYPRGRLEVGIQGIGFIPFERGTAVSPSSHDLFGASLRKDLRRFLVLMNGLTSHDLEVLTQIKVEASESFCDLDVVFAAIAHYVSEAVITTDWVPPFKRARALIELQLVNTDTFTKDSVRFAFADIVHRSHRSLTGAVTSQEGEPTLDSIFHVNAFGLQIGTIIAGLIRVCNRAQKVRSEKKQIAKDAAGIVSAAIALVPGGGTANELFRMVGDRAINAAFDAETHVNQAKAVSAEIKQALANKLCQDEFLQPEKAEEFHKANVEALRFGDAISNAVDRLV